MYGRKDQRSFFGSVDRFWALYHREIADPKIPGSLQEAIKHDESAKNKHWTNAVIDTIEDYSLRKVWTEVDPQELPKTAKIVPAVFLFDYVQIAREHIERKVWISADPRALSAPLEPLPPLVSPELFRFFIAFAARHDLRLTKFAIPDIYLHAVLPSQYSKLYVRLPNVGKTYRGATYKLHKCLYGLPFSDEAWNATIVNYLTTEKGFLHMPQFPGLFFGTFAGGNNCLVLLHRDTFLLASSGALSLGKMMEAMYKFRAEMIDTPLFFRGFQIRTNVLRETELFQIEDIDRVYALLSDEAAEEASESVANTPYGPHFEALLAGRELNDINEESDDLPPNNNITKKRKALTLEQEAQVACFPFRKILTNLKSVAFGTRPDVAWAVHITSQFDENQYNYTLMKAVERICAYLYATKTLCLRYKPWTAPEDDAESEEIHENDGEISETMPPIVSASQLHLFRNVEHSFRVRERNPEFIHFSGYLAFIWHEQLQKFSVGSLIKFAGSAVAWKFDSIPYCSRKVFDSRAKQGCMELISFLFGVMDFIFVGDTSRLSCSVVMSREMRYQEVFAGNAEKIAGRLGGTEKKSEESEKKPEESEEKHRDPRLERQIVSLPESEKGNTSESRDTPGHGTANNSEKPQPCIFFVPEPSKENLFPGQLLVNTVSPREFRLYRRAVGIDGILL